MAGWQDNEDVPIQTLHEGDPAPGLEGLPRMDLTSIETLVPALVDQAIRGPLVLTRHGEEAFVMLPLDVYRRLWAAAPRPPVIDAASPEPGSPPGAGPEPSGGRRGRR